MIRRSLPQRIALAAFNIPFLLGAAIVTVLLVLAAIGPEIAPHDPYLRQPIQWFDGQLFRAPIEPREEYPLGTDEQGRDVLSLLLYGARTTLVIVLIGTSIRLLAGFVLGAMAGWWEGRWIDRLVTTLADFLALIPGLILAILIVYAVGIRKGQVAFVVALAIVGWGGVAKMARSKVLALSKEEFIVGAHAIGLTTVQILSRHVMPNLTSILLSIAAIEIGSSLLLLGELGFLAVFLGGGTFILGDVGIPTQAILETPDWGAMLGSTWRYFRTLPWLPGAPALAFFIAIVGFNLFGHGLQKFIEKGRFYPSGWSVLRFGLVVLGILMASRFVLAQASPETRYKEQAASFDVSRAWTDLGYLTQPALLGRSPGSEQSQVAASYIASQFNKAELTPFPYGSYFQPFEANHGRVAAIPKIELLGTDGEVIFAESQRVGHDPFAPFNGSGQLEAELRIFGNLSPNTFNRTDGLVLYFDSGSFQPSFVMRIVPDHQVPYPFIAPEFPAPLSFLSENPLFVIGESAAVELFAELGLDYDELNQRLEDEQRLDLGTGKQLRVTYGLEYEITPEVNVVGYIPGTDPVMMTERILVVAPYTVPNGFEGNEFPGADENASGVAVMLEVLRQWQEQEYLPKRTVVFAAIDELGGEYLVRNPILPTDSSDSWTTVILDGIGSGDKDLARISAGGGNEQVFDRSARTMGEGTDPLDSWPFFFATATGRGWEVPGDPAYSGIAISRVGGPVSGTFADTRDLVSPALLESAGRVLAHFLITLSSQ
ncbi:MAG: ABC transporter permease subunit [Anaerolineales bacterium]